ncbi:MAG: SurA N-terminal domain-containing protein, partial [Acidobacteriia bacterium]|nr:SurA N-terminal domain-containing protein [Terriglobia bacterium]
MFRLFKKRREAVKKYLLIFFLGIVSVGMVITLAPIPAGDTGQLETNVLADIGGASITSQDLSRSIQSRLRNSPLANDPQFIMRMAGIVLDDMILRRALWTQAKKLGIQVSDREVLQAAQAIPGLYLNGVFVGENWIYQQTGMTVAQFQEQLREGLLQEKMRAVLTDGIRVNPAEVRDEFLRRNAKARIEYVLFDPSQLVKAVNVTPEALEAFFKKDPGQYKVQEQRRVRYVLIDTDRVREQVKVSENELKE